VIRQGFSPILPDIPEHLETLIFSQIGSAFRKTLGSIDQSLVVYSPKINFVYAHLFAPVSKAPEYGAKHH
jgi:hypothetical protein